MPNEGEQNTDNTTDTGGGDTTATDTGGTEHDFAPITSQEDFDKRIQARIARERAKFSDYDDAKSKAAELDKIREGEKTDLQREREAREAAEKRAEKAEFASMRSEVARTKGVPASSLTGATKEELEASADELIAWRDQNAPKKASVKSLKSGTIGTDTPDRDAKSAAAEALRKMRAGG